MKGLRRCVVHAVIFEVFVIAIVTVAFAVLTAADSGRSGVLAAPAR